MRIGACLSFGFIFCLLICQGSFAQQPADSIPNAVKDSIDQLNDYAWEIASKSPDSALIYAEKAIQKSRMAQNYPRGLINANILLGILNKDRGYYETAVGHYLEAMELAEAEGDCLRVSGALNNLGVVAQKQGNYTKALDYFQRSLEIESKFGVDKAQRSIRLFNIGESNELLDSLDEAYAYYYNSLLIEEELESQEGIFYARLGIGKVDSRNGNYRKAGDELAKALAYARQLKNNPGICETLIAMGELALMQQQFAAAQSAFEEALAKAEALSYKSLEMNARHGLYKTARAAGQPQAALEMLESYYEVREELNSVEVNSRIGELQTRYEVAKKEKEIALLRKEEELKRGEQKADRKLRNYFAFTVIFVIVLLLFNLWRNRSLRAKGNA